MEGSSEVATFAAAPPPMSAAADRASFVRAPHKDRVAMSLGTSRCKKRRRPRGKLIEYRRFATVTFVINGLGLVSFGLCIRFKIEFGLILVYRQPK